MEAVMELINNGVKFQGGTTSISNMVFLELLRFQLQFVIIIGTRIP